MKMQVRIRKLDDKAMMPQYKTPHSAGADLYACLEKEIKLDPMESCLVPTGIAMELPPGYEAQVRPRSGMASRGLIIPNSPGTIDADYRGEVKVIVMNLGKKIFTINPHDRIAQLVVQKIHKAEFTEYIELSSTSRGSGGFGSTGSNK